MKQIVLIALVLLVMVGCSETEVDTSSFADGEATALTKEKIKADLLYIEQADWLYTNHSELHTHLKFDHCGYLEFQLYEPGSTSIFSEVYQGDGVWLVQLGDFKWKVYELTHVVETIGTWKPFENEEPSPRHFC
jgi:hypothetical protein